MKSDPNERRGIISTPIPQVGTTPAVTARKRWWGLFIVRGAVIHFGSLGVVWVFGVPSFPVMIAVMVCVAILFELVRLILREWFNP